MKKVFVIAILLVKQISLVAQNIGIGTGNPTKAKLEVHGAVDATSAIFGGESTGISLQRNWPGVGFNQYYNGGSRYIANGYAAVQFVDPASGYMGFDMFDNGSANSIASASKRAMVITNDGRVGIGSGDFPPSTLYVARGTAFDGTAVFAGNKHRSHFNYGNEENTYIRAGKDNGTVIINDIPGSRIAMSGNVGINTSTPEYPLEIRQTNVNGNRKGLVIVDPTTFNSWHYFIAGSTNLVLYFNGSTRGYFNSSNGDYSSLSDRRLKTNVQPISSILPGIMKLVPVNYEMKHDSGEHKKNIGFIAQDVKAVFPELVTVTKDSATGYNGIHDLHAVNYSGFGVLAIKAIQEQQNMIDGMSKRMELLEEQNKLLMQLLKK